MAIKKPNWTALKTMLKTLPVKESFFWTGQIDRNIVACARRENIKIKTQNMFAFASAKCETVERVVKVTIISRIEQK